MLTSTTKTYQPSARAAIITRAKYNRPLDESGKRFETWAQTCDRVIEHQRWLWERAQGGGLTAAQDGELGRLRAAMMARKSMPAGRVLWLGGTELVRRRESACFNCAFAEVSTIHDVVDVFWLLLQGCGVGFSPVTGKLTGFFRRMEVEVIRSARTCKGGRESNAESYDPETRTWTISVGDSAEAWAKSVGKLLAHPYPARKLVVDLSEIRPSGDRLRGYGWICSGDRGLAVAAAAVAAILNRRAGRLLTKEDIWDIINWLGTVLSSRRSAQIGLIDHGDRECHAIATRKYPGFDRSDHWYRCQSNNSIVFHDKPSRRQVREIFEMMAANGGSEPGFVNMAAARRRAPWCKGMNPSLRAGTKVLTDDGVFPIEKLEGRNFLVKNLDGRLSPATCWLSGNNKQLYELTLAGGHKYYATPEHRWPVHLNGRFVKVDTKDLRPGDELPILRQNSLFQGQVGTEDEGFLVGWILGDGWVTIRDNGSQQVGMIVGRNDVEAGIKDRLESILRSIGCEATFHPSSSGQSYELNTINQRINEILERFRYNGKDRLPSLVWRGGTEEFRKGFIDGLFSSDGSIAAAGSDTRICFSSSRESLVREFSELLGFYGLRSNIIGHTCLRSFPNGTSGNFTQWNLRMAGDGNIKHFAATFRLSHARKQARLETLAAKDRYRTRDSLLVRIESIRLTEIREDVWDISVDDDTHCFQLAHCITGNCAEILLGAFCNLTETDISKFQDDDRGLHEALELIARANYRQTAVNLRDGVLQSHWHEQNEYLRLCGVGICGVTARPDLGAYDYRQMKNAAVAGAYAMADELGMERPKNVTTVKPGGTVPKIMDCTEGIKMPDGRFILNRVNFLRDDPILPRLVDAGYRVEPTPNDPDSVLVVLPTSYPTVRFGPGGTNVESAVDQLERYRLIMTHYCEQNASTTIGWRPEEIPALVSWFDRHWDEYVGVSFMFKNDPTKTAEDLGYQYLPQSVVDEATYRDYVAGLSPVDLDDVGDLDAFDAVGIPECEGGACPAR